MGNPREGITMPVDTDPVVRVAWQHDGDRFRVRSIFKSGCVSGMSDPLEPGTVFLSVGDRVTRKKAGEGIYEAPGFCGMFLAVGGDAITRLSKMVQDTCGDSQVSRFKVLDLKARPCLMVHISRSSGSKVTPCSNPQFLPDGWEGSKCS